MSTHTHTHTLNTINMKGKIKSFIPKPGSTGHETFEYKRDTYYVFIVTLEIDGKIQVGDANNKYEKPPWELDKEYEIIHETDERSTNSNRFRIKVERQGYSSGYKSSGAGKTPEDRSEIISQNAFGTAIKYIQVLEPDERKAIIEKYGPEGAFEKFAISISNKIMENAHRIKESYMS